MISLLQIRKLFWFKKKNSLMPCFYPILTSKYIPSLSSAQRANSCNKDLKREKISTTNQYIKCLIICKRVYTWIPSPLQWRGEVLISGVKLGYNNYSVQFLFYSFHLECCRQFIIFSWFCLLHSAWVLINLPMFLWNLH